MRFQIPLSLHKANKYLTAVSPTPSFNVVEFMQFSEVKLHLSLRPFIIYIAQNVNSEIQSPILF